MKNPYEILGVAPSASAADIQKTYRTLAKKLHPDLNPGDRSAEEKFKEVSSAYDFLRDETRRKRFDAGEIDASGAEMRPKQHYYRDFAHADDGHAYSSGAGFSDFMEGDDPLAELLRRSQRARANRRGEDHRYRMSITFAESIAGGSKRLTMPDGGTLDVKIPPGMVEGQVLRLKGKGGQGTGSGEPGDALIEVEIMPDPRFVRDGDNITVEVPVSLHEAVLGGTVRVPTPTGDVDMSVPKGANSGTILRLRGKGAPRGDGTMGDEFVKLKIVLPKGPDADLEAFVAGWDRGRTFNPREG